MKTKVAIIGYGTMGRAIAGALKREVSVFPVRRNTPRTRAAKEISGADFVILAVKPQDAAEALGQLGSNLREKNILISIMAGVPLRKLARMSGHTKIIRLMPNLGLLLGEGMAVWKSTGLRGGEKTRARRFLDKITENFEVKNEDAVDRATAISGSGPAYFLFFAEGLARAARSLGFTAEESLRLVSKTLKAAAVLGREGDYAAFIKKVASKKGTTDAALKVFQNIKLEKIVKDAVGAAYKRAKELSK